MIYPNNPLYLLNLLGYIYYLTYHTLTTKEDVYKRQEHDNLDSCPSVCNLEIISAVSLLDKIAFARPSSIKYPDLR